MSLYDQWKSEKAEDWTVEPSKVQLQSVGPVEKKEKTFNIAKTDDDQRLVFGWASIAYNAQGEQLVDHQGDMIDSEDLEEAAYKFVLKFRDTGEEHIPTMRKKGKLVESVVFTKEKQRAMGIPDGLLPVGWWIGFHIDDDAAWEKIKSGHYRMFSVEGAGMRTPVKKSKPVTFFDVIQKFNPYHDRLGRFASAGGGGAVTFSANPNTKAGKLAIERAGKDNPLIGAAFNRQYGSTNTKDAVDEINSGKTNSLAAHMDKNGNLTPEREAVHKQIIDDLLEGKVPVAGQATMTMLGGGPASGKSSVMNPDTSKDKNAVTVDPDAIKAMLPGYAEMAKQSSNAASFYHEESSALAKRFSEVAYKENYNVIYDGTADGSVNSVMKKVNGAKANGYRVEMKYVSIDTEEAVRRNQKRYDDAVAAGQTPRLPPVDMVIRTHTKCTDISVAVAKDVDHIEIWDNNGARGQQKLVAVGGNGKGLVATDKAGFDRYLSKGSAGLEGFTTLPDGQVVPIE